MRLPRKKKPGPDWGRKASRKLHQSAQAPDRPQAGTEGEQQRSERQTDVVERGGGDEGALQMRRQQEDSFHSQSSVQRSHLSFCAAV